MKKNITSKVSVLIQGEGSNGEIVDRNMDCNSVVVFALCEDSIDVATFGAFNALDTAHLANTMDELKQELFDQFPHAKLLATLAQTITSEEDEEDE
jgi:hypothetical protein